MADQIRVRYAPSPTGYLHVGGARTALYSYLFANGQKHLTGNKGSFVLRVEDTDQERSTEESLRLQVEDLHWLGLHWDEGVDPETLKDSGDYGPYRQSERSHIYKKYADELLAKGQAYYCFLTDQEIESQREQAKKASVPLQINSPFRDLSLDEAKAKLNAGESAVVRFKTPEMYKEYSFTDMVRGEVKFPSDMVNDFVLLRSNGMPVYNFCCVIDDHLMGISHVFRAEEHLNNTLRQMMIYESLGWGLPEFGHMSIILGPDKQKLSKRHGATSVGEYRKAGYLQEALINYLALLGWNDGTDREEYNLEDLIETFIKNQRFHKAPAVFDEEKLRFMNGVHIRLAALGDDSAKDYLWQRMEPFFSEAGLELPSDKTWQRRSLETFGPRMETLKDAVEFYRPLSLAPMDIAEESKETLSWDSSPQVIQKWQELLGSRSEEFLTSESFGELQNQVKTDCGVKGKHLFMPIRVAVIGKPHGADLKELVPLMKREELVKRAQTVLGQ